MEVEPRLARLHKSTWERLEAYQHDNRIKNTTEALRQLVEAALKQAGYGKDKEATR